MANKIYVISDIHARISLLKEIMNYIKLDDSDHLYVLGDLIDYKNENLETLQYLYELDKKSNIKILKGNHETLFLDCIKDESDKYLYFWFGRETIIDLLTDDELDQIEKMVEKRNFITCIEQTLKDFALPIIREKYKKIVKWLDELPVYTEMIPDRIVGVHASINEKSIDWKKDSTVDDYLWGSALNKGLYCTNKGKQLIISGHIDTNIIRDESNDFDIFYDYTSHVYIANHNKNRIPLLIIEKQSEYEYKLTGVRCDERILHKDWETYEVGSFNY